MSRISNIGGQGLPVLDARYVNVTGDVMTGNLSVPSITHQNTYVSTGSEPIGTTYYDTANHTISTVLENGVTLQHGQEMHIYGKNVSGAIIHNGDAVSITTAGGSFTAFTLADATNVGLAYAFVGIATEELAINAFGYVTAQGLVHELNTSNFDEGKAVYVDPASPGHLTKTFPVVPNYIINVGVVTYKHAVHGIINVQKLIQPKLADLSDVNGTLTTTTGQILVWNQTGGYWDATDNITNYLLKSGSLADVTNHSHTVLTDIGTNTHAQIDTALTRLVNTSGTNTGDNSTNTTYEPARLFPIDIYRFGFLNQTQTSISFDGTKIFTLSDVGAGWSYYRSGLKYTISGNKTVDLTTVDATLVNGKVYYIYIDSTTGVLTASGSSWTLNDTKVPVATVLWNNTLTPKYWLADERHSCLIDRRYHYIEHYTEGCKLQTRGALTLGGAINTDTNAAKVFAIAETTLLDEDFIHVESALALPNGTNTDYMVFYRTSASTWEWKASNMPFVYNVGNSNNWIQYDNGGTMTDMTGGAGGAARYINSYLLVTNIEGVARYIIIPSQVTTPYTSLAAAQAEAPSSFNFTGFPVIESAFMYQMTWTTVTSTSQGKCRLAATPKALSLSALSSVSTGSSIDHNLLSGLQGGTTSQYYHLNSEAGTHLNKTTGTVASSATPTINTDVYNHYTITALAADITSFTTNLSGTPVSGDTLWIEITGTATRAIAWGASFEASTVALPTTTVSTARLDVLFVFNPVSSCWRIVDAS